MVFESNDLGFLIQELSLTDVMILLDDVLEFKEQYPNIIEHISLGTYRFGRYTMIAEPNHKFDKCVLSIYLGDNLVWSSDYDFGKVVYCRYAVANQVLRRINKVLSLGWIKQ